MGKLKDKFLDFRDDTLDFVDNHRLGLIIISIIAIVLLAYIAFRLFTFSTTSIIISSADPNVGEIIGTNDSYVDYKATSRNSKKGDSNGKVTWEADAGYVQENEDGTIRWFLPSEAGTYTITATDEKGETGKKSVTVIGNRLSLLYTTANYDIKTKDNDGDGLTNDYERDLGTKDDQKDSDNDGLYDGDEIVLGYNPLSTDSKNDGTKDRDRISDFTFKTDNVSVKMHGTGNFTQSTVDKYSTETLDNVGAVLDGLYAFYTEADIQSGVEITFNYDKTKVAEKGLNEASLAIYSLDDQVNSFTKVSTSKINTDNATITCSVDKLGKFFIADSSKLTSNLSTELVFLIDNSGSMYSSEEVAGSEENDVDFNRVDVTKKLVDKLQGNYKFGAGKFTFDYTELIELSSDKAAVKNMLESIRGVPEKSFTGTYIGRALEGGLKQFNDVVDNNRRYIILLSDGEDTTNVSGYDKKLLESQIKLAATKNVKVYTIGLGNVIDEKSLKSISDGTNGKYYFAATADDLDEIFDLICADLNYNLYDTTGNEEDDSVILANSGFYVKRDGFAFSNFINTQEDYGYSYGMALFAKLFYEGNLPDKLSAKKISNVNVRVNGNDTTKTVEAPSSDTKKLREKIASSLRTYAPETEGLTILSNLPDNFWASEISDKTLSINSIYASKLTNIGFQIVKSNYTADNKAKFNVYETLRFDVSQYLEPELSKDAPLGESDGQLIRTLSRYDITKYRDDKYEFSDHNDTAFEKLTQELVEGRPVMLRINGEYSVLATKLLMDRTNMNKFKIEVYDPNYAGAKKYIEVDRCKFADVKENTNEVTDVYEYRFTYQGTQVGVCLSFVNIIENV